MAASNDVFTTTFEDVQATAQEFGRLVFQNVQENMVIVCDDTIYGVGFICNFPNNPDGWTNARRFAVRLHEEDIDSTQSFRALCRKQHTTIAEKNR